MSTLTAVGVGRLGRDPETRDTEWGQVVSVSVAFDHGYGERRTTTWARVSAWGKLGETLAKLRKGNRVSVAGEIYTSEYMAGGESRQDVEIKAHGITVIDWPDQADTGPGAEPDVSKDPRVQSAKRQVAAAVNDPYKPRSRKRSREAVERLVAAEKEAKDEAKGKAKAKPTAKAKGKPAAKVHAPPYKDGEIPF